MPSEYRNICCDGRGLDFADIGPDSVRDFTPVRRKAARGASWVRRPYRAAVKNTRRYTVLLLVAAFLFGANSIAALAGPFGRPPLGTAGNFAVLAGTTVTNTGPTWITGQVGLSPGTSVTGFPPGTSGAKHVADPTALTAKNDLTTAYLNAAGQTPCTPLTGDLGGKSLVAGLYCYSSGAVLTGTLTLTGAGPWVFQIGSTLTTASNATVSVIDPTQACDVFWQVGSSATLGTTTTFVGTIMALTSIAVQHGAKILPGRALAQNGAVTLDTNTITQPTGCGYAAPAAVAPPVTGAPSSGGGPLQGESFPWVLALVVGVLAGGGVVGLGLGMRGYRRRTS
jgi:hypothetical protein